MGGGGGGGRVVYWWLVVVLVVPAVGRGGAGLAGWETVSHQPAVYHVSAGLPDEIVLEEIGVLVQESLHSRQVRARRFSL